VRLEAVSGCKFSYPEVWLENTEPGAYTSNPMMLEKKRDWMRGREGGGERGQRRREARVIGKTTSSV
jgi:hypothetical protein